MANSGDTISVKEAQKILASNDPNQRLESKSLSIALESKGGASMKSRDGSAYLDYLGQFYSPLALGGSFYKGKWTPTLLRSSFRLFSHNCLIT